MRFLSGIQSSCRGLRLRLRAFTLIEMMMVIAIISAAGVASHLLAGQSLDKAITAWFVLGGLAGMGLGILLSRRLAGPLLQKLFAGMMVAVAVYMLLRNF